MKALHLGALLAVCVVSSATAQTSVGPVAITNMVNGVPVTVNATSWITVNSSGNELTVQARIFADLVDLQKKFASILDGFKLPIYNCANRAADTQNPVVSFRNGPSCRSTISWSCPCAAMSASCPAWPARRKPRQC